MQRLKAKRRRPVFTPFTSNPPAAAFLQNIITQSNLQKANLHFWDHPCPNSSWFIQEKLWKISHQKNWWTFTKKNTKPFLKRERDIFLSSRFFMAAESWMISDEDLIFHYLGRVVGFLAEVHWDPFVRSFWSFVGPFHTVAQIQTPLPSLSLSLFIFHFSLSLFHTVAQIQTPIPSLSLFIFHLSLSTFHFHFCTPSHRYKCPFHPFHFHCSLFTFSHRRADTNALSIQDQFKK